MGDRRIFDRRLSPELLEAVERSPLVPDPASGERRDSLKPSASDIIRFESADM
jgi:hypothetical protein